MALDQPVLEPGGLEKLPDPRLFWTGRELVRGWVEAPIFVLLEKVGEVGKFRQYFLISYGHITLDIPDPIRTLKSSRVEPT